MGIGSTLIAVSFIVVNICILYCRGRLYVSSFQKFIPQYSFSLSGILPQFKLYKWLKMSFLLFVLRMASLLYTWLPRRTTLML